MDVRTGWILPGWVRKTSYNTGILLESLAFRHVSIITEALRKKLKLPLSKCHLIPLGAEVWDIAPKKFDSMRLLYVGTFQNRHIYKTVQGFDLFAREARNDLPLSYDLIGKGTPEENAQMEATIQGAQNRDLIKYHGRVLHRKLVPYFESCNIGVAFVPLIDAQAAQPYTKVYEYLQAGMPVVATANPSNLIIITAENGVMCLDTPESFSRALQEMRSRLSQYNWHRIKAGGHRFSWRSIVQENVKPYFSQLLSTRGGGDL
jgi:glycosyltransferase involved in cell wall biosynthesis